MQARAVMGVMTFQARVDTDRGWLRLTVRGDLFEVSHPFPLARFLNGLDYCYRAEDTTVELVPGSWHDWIEIGAAAGNRVVPHADRAQEDDPPDLGRASRAGAQPIEPPSQP